MVSDFTHTMQKMVTNISFSDGFLICLFTLLFVSVCGHFFFKRIHVYTTDKLQETLLLFLGIVSSSLFYFMIFISMNVWKYTQDVLENSAREASALVALWHFVNSAQNEQAPLIRYALEQYVGIIKGSGVRAMNLGEDLPKEQEIWAKLYLAVDQVAKLPALQNSFFYSHLVTVMDSLVYYRKSRWVSLRGIVPLELRRGVVLLCLLMVFSLGIFFRAGHMVVTFGVVGYIVILAFGLDFILMLEFPYTGIASNVGIHNLYSHGPLGQIPSI